MTYCNIPQQLRPKTDSDTPKERLVGLQRGVLDILVQSSSNPSPAPLDGHSEIKHRAMSQLTCDANGAAVGLHHRFCDG